MKYIKGFDGLRCYSIILVMFTHLGFAHYFPANTYLRENLFYFISGAAGVNMFFAISGFLISFLLLNEIKFQGSINLKFFFIRRFLRLLPPIIPFYIALFIFMNLGYVRETYIGLTASILYLYNFVPKAKMIWSPELSHTWSLAVEEQFYLFWALTLRYIKMHSIYFIVIGIVILSIVCSYILPGLTITYKDMSHSLGDVFFIKRWVIPAIAPILIGSLTAIINHHHYSYIHSICSSRKAGFIALLIFISPLYTPSSLIPIMRILHGTGASLILLWVFHNQNSKIVNLLEWRLFKYIGMISYGLYIWQGFFIRTGPLATPKIWVHEYPYNIILTFIVAILSYEFYEKRITIFKKRFKVNVDVK